MHASTKPMLLLAARRAFLGTTLALLFIAAAANGAQAQLKGVTGAVGGVAGAAGLGGIAGAGAAGSGSLSSTSGALGGGAGAITSRSDPAPVLDNTIKLGITIPSNFGPATQPLAPLPPAVDNLSKAGGGITNTLANPLGTVNEGVRPRAGAAPALPARRTGVPPPGEQRYVPNEVVISLPSNLTGGALDELAARHRLTPVESYQIGLTATTIHRWQFADARSVPEVIRALESDSRITAAQPNYRFILQQGDGAASLAGMQYALAKLNIVQAHRISTGRQVLVAVIDSGIDVTHPEIAGMVVASFDAVPAEQGADAHGTAMAGAIVAHAQLKGVAPAARLLAVRAFTVSGNTSDGTTLGIASGIDWAVAHGARVINMSFAGPYDPSLARVLASARQKGVVLVAAAGNAGSKSPPLYPAADANVIAVTATDAQDKLLPVAVRGKHIAVSAPGVDIVGPAPGGGFQISTGTSVAAAHVSGIAALLCAQSRAVTGDSVRKALLSSAIDLGPKGRDDQFGAGLADAYNALQALPAATVGRRPETISAAR
jgi:subtilisin family serine protease